MKEGDTRKAFTVEQANALLPVLEGILDQLSALLSGIERHEEQIQLLEVLWGRKLLEPGNPDRAEVLEHRRAARAEAARVQEIVEDEILARGIRFPAGGLEHGLLDFPTTFEGRWVYLCWRRGEERITHWHEVYAGFAGRRAVGPLEAARMGTEDDPGAVDDSALDF